MYSKKQRYGGESDVRGAKGRSWRIGGGDMREVVKEGCGLCHGIHKTGSFMFTGCLVNETSDS